MKPRDRLVLLVVAVLGIAAGGWFGLVAPQRSQAQQLADEIVVEREKLSTAKATLATAQEAKQRYRSDYATVARLGKAVPVSDDVPSLVFQIETAAADLGIEFEAVQVTATGAGVTPAQGNAAAVAAVAPPAEGDEKDDEKADADAAQQPAATAGVAPTTVGSAAFTTMPFSFTFDGSYFAMQKLLGRLTRFTQAKGTDLVVRGRLITIDGLQLGAGEAGFPKVKATVTATAFILPAQEGLLGAAGPGTPTGPALPAAVTTGAPR